MLDLERSYRELAESERRYHELFDVASDVIFTFDDDGTITLVNRRIHEMLGVHPAEVVGRPVRRRSSSPPRGRRSRARSSARSPASAPASRSTSSPPTAARCR